MRTESLCLGMIAAIGFAGTKVGAITVDGTELTPYTSITNQLAMSHGAVFNSTAGFVTFYEQGPNIWGISGTDPSANPIAGYGWYSSPITVEFVDMGDGVTPTVVNGTITAVWGDNGGDLDGIRLRAYDLSNNLIGTATDLSVAYSTFSFTGSGIHKLVFDQSGLGAATSDTFLDSLTYPTPVSTPAPGAAVVLGGGLVAVSRRRR